MLTLIETDPETGLDKIVHVDPINIAKPPARDRLDLARISWEAWGKGPDGTDYYPL